ncbi:MAG: sugar ABC transporter ATP-binding protein [Armatimonadota bacterium]|nr:MAG: sugar ABC transporter ATP-binding protein [Armatimonadota bacterium]
MNDNPVVEFKGVTKRFPGVVALDDVSVRIARGACHGLVGENGAGKSTLGRILAGIYRPDSGHVVVDSRPVRLASPRDALAAGIGIVHQELAFCENLSVAENLCLGQTPAKGPFVSRGRMIERALDRLRAIGARVDVERRLGELPISQQQIIQIAAAVGRGARILIFDEPTSSLSQAETERLFELIKRLQRDGVTSIYISHRLSEVFRLCETITVLRDGQVVATRPTSELDEAALVRLMIGRPYEAYFPSHLEAEPGEELLRVEGLSSAGKFESVSFTLRAGEILGLAGLVGSGRTEIAQALFGLDPLVGGRVFIAGAPADIAGRPAAAMELGLGLIPEDRKRHGLVLPMTAKQNITLPTLHRLARMGWIRSKAEESLARRYFDLMRIRAPSMNVVSAGLSGGNQQKLVIARWLAAQCRILLVDEPTRGVDVGTKAEIHGLIDRLAREGSGILLISSELPEILNLSTRMLVLRHGRIAGKLSREECTQEAVMRLMAGMDGS